jgi:hypothetical protein
MMGNEAVRRFEAAVEKCVAEVRGSPLDDRLSVAEAIGTLVIAALDIWMAEREEPNDVE